MEIEHPLPDEKLWAWAIYDARICPRCRLPWGTDEHDIAGCGQDPK